MKSNMKFWDWSESLKIHENANQTENKNEDKLMQKYDKKNLEVPIFVKK
jgi:hypothetical protein